MISRSLPGMYAGLTATVTVGDQVIALHPSSAIDISIPVTFDSTGTATPRCFSLPAATTAPVVAGGWTGAVDAGASVNCPILELCAHGNGTHTECVGHILPGSITLLDVGIGSVICPAILLSVTPVALGTSSDTYASGIASDAVITRGCLEDAFAKIPSAASFTTAIVLRTLPALSSKRVFNYSGTNPPYLTAEAAAWLVTSGAMHVLVDLPSVDREDDGGRLIAHRTLFRVGLDVDLRTADVRGLLSPCSVTELCYIPDDVPDGRFILQLHVAPIAQDAAPSRPWLFPVAEASI